MTHSLAHPELHREFRGLIIAYDPDEGTTSIGEKNQTQCCLFTCFPVLRQFDAENILS